MRSEGCACCRDIEAHQAHTAALARLLNVKQYDDKSGYDFDRYRSGRKTAR